MPQAPAHGTSSNARHWPGSVVQTPPSTVPAWHPASVSAEHGASASSETAPSGQPGLAHPQLPQSQQPIAICVIHVITTAGGGEWGGVNEGRVGRRAGRGAGSGAAAHCR